MGLTTYDLGLATYATILTKYTFIMKDDAFHKRFKDFAIAIIRFTRKFPEEQEYWTVKKQNTRKEITQNKTMKKHTTWELRLGTWFVAFGIMIGLFEISK